MSDEEILRKKLDRLNENSYYGIMVDTEITNIVRNHIKRLEENKMKATSTETFKDIIAIDFELQTFPNPDEQDKFIVSATNRDDIFCFVFEGPYIADTCRKAGLFTNWEKDQKIRELEKENEKLKKQLNAVQLMLDNFRKDHEDILKTQREKHKDEVEQLKQHLKQVENNKERLTNRYNALSSNYEKEISKVEKIREENENLKNAYDILDNTLNKTQKKCNEWYEKWVKWLHKYEHIKKEYKEKLDVLQRKYDLEKAANEAQHKFIREYAGKGTEVQFNYAIDDAKEVSYAIVDKEENECKCESCSAGASYEEMYRKLIDDLKEENKKLKEENFCVKSRINAYKNTNGKLQDEVLELKYQLKDIQATKEVVEQKLNTRAGILDQAKKCVCGQREQDYGTPESNFQLIADLWNGYLKKERLGRSKTVVDAVDVSMMMALMKIARIKNGGGSGDSFVDLAGYAACGGEIWHGQKVKDQN